MDKIIEFAPIILVILMFLLQHNIFVSPNQLEIKHREIIDDVTKKLQNYVERNAYKEFQNRVLTSINNVDKTVNELKDYLMGKGKTKGK